MCRTCIAKDLDYADDAAMYLLELVPQDVSHDSSDVLVDLIKKYSKKLMSALSFLSDIEIVIPDFSESHGISGRDLYWCRIIESQCLSFGSVCDIVRSYLQHLAYCDDEEEKERLMKEYNKRFENTEVLEMFPLEDLLAVLPENPTITEIDSLFDQIWNRFEDHLTMNFDKVDLEATRCTENILREFKSEVERIKQEY